MNIEINTMKSCFLAGIWKILDHRMVLLFPAIVIIQVASGEAGGNFFFFFDSDG